MMNDDEAQQDIEQCDECESRGQNCWSHGGRERAWGVTDDEAQQNGRAMIEQAAAQLGVSLDPPSDEPDPYAEREASVPFNLNVLRGLLAGTDMPSDVRDSAWQTVERLAAAFKALHADLATLLPIGHMYLEALDADPENEMLTLPGAIGVTAVREVVERNDPTVRDA